MKHPPKQAVALSYSKEASAAPVVKAKGKGEVAERIVAIAAENGVPVREDASLVEVLSKLDLEQEIPPELYQLVAEVLSFVYRTDQAAKERADKRDERR
ncbi:EscU/YscU/HrcU family type III secretion system export apparatus switch protein [Paenibacillus sp.]|uniref:EscU/YscU/HrcU family type III secretion system export apparatus switch protein n=1 Tax=Paenibacillus sp. TaxID=58172 RepID=UPI002D6A2A5C|nr:EscU/YscU/HrcU family type III secretion system export apparatus switch protein [Paenibacillus sp.]HZG57908.1 EscU/YscU/HrcU family type III secretion system export apparatus switch protein [Paenibacillus sp.]